MTVCVCPNSQHYTLNKCILLHGNSSSKINISNYIFIGLTICKVIVSLTNSQTNEGRNILFTDVFSACRILPGMRKVHQQISVGWMNGWMDRWMTGRVSGKILGLAASLTWVWVLTLSLSLAQREAHFTSFNLHHFYKESTIMTMGHGASTTTCVCSLGKGPAPWSPRALPHIPSQSSCNRELGSVLSLFSWLDCKLLKTRKCQIWVPRA